MVHMSQDNEPKNKEQKKEEEDQGRITQIGYCSFFFLCHMPSKDEPNVK
jgi:hypothetical protein